MSNEKKASGNTPRRRIVLPDGTVFTAYNVVKTTKAPPWTKPTTHKPAAPVDWSFWPASRRVTPEEAIALSLDLDPHSLYSNTDGHINPEFCPDNATALLFLKRLNLFADCDSRTKILLSEFAVWAVSISLAPIPPEIEAIANAAKSKETHELVKVGAGDTADDSRQEKEPPPVTATVVKEAFQPIEWGERLSKVSSTKYQWLNSAVRYAGSPRPGDAKKFSLAAVAVALVSEKKLNLIVAENIIKKHPEWLPEWNESSEYLTKN